MDRPRAPVRAPARNIARCRNKDVVGRLRLAFLPCAPPRTVPRHSRKTMSDGSHVTSPVDDDVENAAETSAEQNGGATSVQGPGIALYPSPKDMPQGSRWIVAASGQCVQCRVNRSDCALIWFCFLVVGCCLAAISPWVPRRTYPVSTELLLASAKLVTHGPTISGDTFSLDPARTDFAVVPFAFLHWATWIYCRETTVAVSQIAICAPAVPILHSQGGWLAIDARGNSVRHALRGV